MEFIENNKSWLYPVLSIILGVLMMGIYFSPVNISSDSSTSVITIRTPISTFIPTTTSPTTTSPTTPTTTISPTTPTTPMTTSPMTTSPTTISPTTISPTPGNTL